MTLQERLRALTEPCRDVDAEIAKVFSTRFVMYRLPGKYFLEGGEELPHYTASLDAVVELVEQELPGWFWAINAVDPQGKLYIAEVGDKADDAGVTHSMRAVALLLALIEAKEASD